MYDTMIRSLISSVGITFKEGGYEFTATSLRTPGTVRMPAIAMASFIEEKFGFSPHEEGVALMVNEVNAFFGHSIAIVMHQGASEYRGQTGFNLRVEQVFNNEIIRPEGIKKVYIIDTVLGSGANLRRMLEAAHSAKIPVAGVVILHDQRRKAEGREGCTIGEVIAAEYKITHLYAMTNPESLLDAMKKRPNQYVDMIRKLEVCVNKNCIPTARPHAVLA